MSNIPAGIQAQVDAIPEQDFPFRMMQAIGNTFGLFEGKEDQIRIFLTYVLTGAGLPEDVNPALKTNSQYTRALFLRFSEDSQSGYRALLQHRLTHPPSGGRRRRASRKVRKAQRKTRRRRAV